MREDGNRRRPAARVAARVLVLGTLAWAGATGCAATVSGGAPPGPVYREDGRAEPGPPLGIPRGHLPPPGECRVWFPGRPPGQQPPPGGYGEAMAHAPAGSCVLYRPDRAEVHARVLDPRRAGVVVRVRVYEAAGGRFLRTERP